MAAGFSIGILATAASAKILLNDSFTLPDGPLETAPGWTVGTPSFGSVIPTESKIRIHDDALFWDGAPRMVNSIVCRPLTSPGRRLQGLVFIGLVLNVSAPPAAGGSGRSSGGFLALCNDAGNSQRVMLGLAPSPTQGHFRLSLGHSQLIDEDNLIAGDFPAGRELRLIVGHDSVRNTSSIWISPTGEDVPASHVAPMPAKTGLSSLAVRMLNNAQTDLGTLSITRLVTATTFAEALPPR